MSDTGSARFINRPSSIEYGQLKFLIMDAPNDQLLPTYAEMLKKRHVKVVIRACEPTYDPSLLEENGIIVVDMSFPDGDVPSSSMVQKWISILKTHYPSVYDKKASNQPVKQAEGTTTSTTSTTAADGTSRHKVSDHQAGKSSAKRSKSNGTAGSDEGENKVAIAVHCIASLGRSPLLVAVALIEAGCTVNDAVNIVRSKRKGAFNTKQLRYLMDYKRAEKTAGCCSIM